MFNCFLPLNFKRKKSNKAIFDILNCLTTYRLDVKNYNLPTNNVEIEANDVSVVEPKWFTDDQGIGKLIESNHMIDVIKIKAVNDGLLKFIFRGKYKCYNDKHYPFWIDFKSIKINGSEILSEPISVWHDIPYRCEIPVKNGQIITLKIKQQYHQYTPEELNDILLKSNIQTETKTAFLTYYKKNIGFSEIKYTWDYVKNNILTQKPQCVDINNLQGEKGRLQIVVENTRFESVLTPSKTKKLYVFLTAVGNNYKNDYPQFHRISWCDKLDGMCLFLDDPTRIKMKEEKSKSPAYYFGTKEKGIVDYLCQIVIKIAKENHISHKNIIFISSSNGGFAALCCCNKLSGSKCIALNPQIDVNLYALDEFFKIMEIERNDPMFFDRLNILKILKNNTSHFFICSNILSGGDRKQMELLYRHAGKKMSLGLTQLSTTTKCLLCAVSAIHPHCVFPDEYFVQIIEKIMTQKITKKQQFICDAFVGEMKRFYFQNREFELLKNPDLAKK